MHVRPKHFNDRTSQEARDKPLTDRQRSEIDDVAIEMLGATLKETLDEATLRETLEEHRWNITETFRSLGILRRKEDIKIEEMISIFQRCNLLGELKDLIASKLKEKRGNVNQIAADLGIPQFTCATLVNRSKKFPGGKTRENSSKDRSNQPAQDGKPKPAEQVVLITPSFDRATLIKTLNENDWNIQLVRSILKLPKEKTILEICRDFNATDELKQKFLERLKERNHRLNDIAIDFEIPIQEVLDLVLLCRNEILIGPQSYLSASLSQISPEEINARDQLEHAVFGGPALQDLKRRYSTDVINIWQSSGLDIRRLARYVGAPVDTPFIRVFLHYGTTEDLKDRITEELKRHNQDASKVCSTFNIGENELKEICSFFHIELPALYNEADIRRIIHEELESLLEVYVPYLATRYSSNVINILWGVVGSRLKGTYDHDKLKELIDEHIEIMVDKEVEAEEAQQVVKQATEPDSDSGIRCFDPNELSSEEIRKIARKIDNTLEEKIIEEGVREIVSGQAFIFLRKLEEKRLFREFECIEKDRLTPELALAEIDRMIKSESGIMRVVLEDLQKEFNETIPIREKLYQIGLKETTVLSLYQLIGVLRMLKGKGVLQADKMGLGKTLQTICVFLLSGKNDLFVMGPKGSFVRWMEDLAKFTNFPCEVVLLTEEPPAKRLEGKKQIEVKTFSDTQERLRYFLEHCLSNQEKPARKRMILMNYDILPQLADLKKEMGVEKMSVDFIALDEAHLLKNPKASYYSIVYGNGNGSTGIDAEYKYPLTGTPLENDSGDVLSYLRYVSIGGTSKAERLFAETDRRVLSRRFRSSDPESMSELHGFLSTKMVRRLKEDVMTNLPAKRIVIAKLDPINRTMTLNDQEVIHLKGDYSTQLYLYDLALHDPVGFERLYGSGVPSVEMDLEDPEQRILGNVKCKQITRLEQIATDPSIFGVKCDSIKFDAVQTLARPRFDAGKSMITFHNYVDPARNLRDLLANTFGPNEVAHIDGAVVNRASDMARSLQVERFQGDESNEPEAHILNATIWTMGLSRDLTQADYIMHLNRTWKQSTEDQGIDRVHRYDPIRHYQGKEIEIIFFEWDHPLVPIDTLKRKVIKKKSILEEMVIEGNLNPRIVSAFKKCDQTVIQHVRAAAAKPLPENRYELTIGQKLSMVMDEIARAGSPRRRQELLDEAAPLYAQFLEHKSTFYGNMASLDYLSSEKFPQLKGRDLTALDLGCGTAVLYHAREKKKSELEQRNFRLCKIDGLDISPLMLALGGNKEGTQMVGTFKNLRQLPSESEDIINLSHAIRYVEHPADLVENIHRILTAGGVCTFLMPKSIKVPQRFEQGFIDAGFDVSVGSGSKLHSELDDKSYRELIEKYGLDIADDIKAEAHAEFTYFVANKARPRTRKPSDGDFVLTRTVYPNVTEGKIRKLLGPLNIPMNLPEGGTVQGKVIHGTEEKTPERYSKERDYRRIHRKISIISQLATKAATKGGADRRSRESRQKACKDIQHVFDALTEDLATNKQSLSKKQRERLKDELNALRGKPVVRQVISSFDSLIDEMTREFT